MEGVELELERRSKFLNNLIQQKKKAKEQQDQKDEFNVRVRASDMPLSVQNRAFSLSRELLNATPGKADNKRLALALKKDFDSAYGPAWHCMALHCWDKLWFIRDSFRWRILIFPDRQGLCSSIQDCCGTLRSP
ncbi:unnamed protein product, partial [Brassica rapa]